jgi:hypothetical protein
VNDDALQLEIEARHASTRDQQKGSTIRNDDVEVKWSSTIGLGIIHFDLTSERNLN